MLFNKKPSINILTCITCKSTGTVGFGHCPDCRGMLMGHYARGWWLYWGFPETRYRLALEKGRHIFNKIRWITILLFGINAWVWMCIMIYQRDLQMAFLGGPESWISAYKFFTQPMKLLFWCGLLLFTYVWYRSLREKEFKGVVEHRDYLKKDQPIETKNITDWKDVRRIKTNKRHDISDAFTAEALQAVGDGYRFADGLKDVAVEPAHVFAALLSSNRISNVFIRLGFAVSTLQKKIEPIINKVPGMNAQSAGAMPLLSSEVTQIIFQSYEKAYNAHQDYVSVTELLLATVEQDTDLQEMLYDLGIDQRKLENVVEWARIRERLHRQYLHFRVSAHRRSKTGMDKAMTALATPYLNQFSDDLTLLAKFGHLDTCVAREEEMEEIFRVVAGGGSNVLLAGDHGVGKKSIVEGLAQRMVEDDVPDRLKDKRLVRLSVSSLLAGTTPAGAVDRLNRIMNDMARARNVILFIHNIHELVGVSAGEGKSSLDVADTLAEHLNSGKFLTFATTTTEALAQAIANTALSNVFTKVEIREMDQNQAIHVLESQVGFTEYKQQVFFSYDSIEKAVKMAAKFLHDTYLPGSALEVMKEAAAYAKNKKGPHALVTVEEVAAVISEKTKIPVTTVSADESSKLMHLEEEMHKRVIGQNEAVNLVANALRRARAEIRSTTKPIASFLFLGPTGVGKTELAKTIAVDYFGGEERMIRLDMSEYQDKGSVYRLIGTPGQKGTGVLTEAVRTHPFALLLLDEIEKADKDILNLFLQVMDDGRLTDSAGHVIDFTNVIIIATSNAGTAYVQEQTRVGLDSDKIKEKLLHGELKDYYRPEFLNRFDGIVLFKSLTHEDIKKVCAIMLKRVAKDLEAKGMELEVKDIALEYLSDVGFDPEFGARPMRRAIQEKVENPLAELLLSGKLERRDKVVLEDGGELRVVRSR